MEKLIRRKMCVSLLCITVNHSTLHSVSELRSNLRRNVRICLHAKRPLMLSEIDKKKIGAYSQIFIRTVQYKMSWTSLLTMADMLHVWYWWEKWMQFLHCFTAKVPVVNCAFSIQPTANSTDSFIFSCYPTVLYICIWVVLHYIAALS